MATGKAPITPIGTARSAAARATRRSPAPATTTATDLKPSATEAAAADVGVLRVLPLNALRPADDNVRRDLGDLGELAASIRGQGILQALLVNDAGDGTFPIVAGHRRHAAAAIASLTEVPCIVRSLDEIARLEAMIVENIQRSGLSPLEEADGFRRLTDLTGMGQRALGDRLGRSQAHVSKRLALLTLPEPAQAALAAGDLTLEDAHTLTRLKDQPDRISNVLTTAKISRGWSVARLVDQELERAEEQEKVAAAVAAVPAGTAYELVDYLHRSGTTWRQLGNLPGEVNLTKAKHRKQPCHLLVIDRQGTVTPCCSNPTGHAEYTKPSWEPGRSAGGGLSDQEKKDRAESRRRNKELKIAAAGRLVHLHRLVDEAAADDELLHDAVEAWLGDLSSYEDRHLLSLTCELLHLEPTKDTWGTTNYLTVLTDRKARPWAAVALALTLAAGEWQARAQQGWDTPAVTALYRRLKAHGYQPCPDELTLLTKARG